MFLEPLKFLINYFNAIKERAVDTLQRFQHGIEVKIEILAKRQRATRRREIGIDGIDGIYATAWNFA